MKHEIELRDFQRSDNVEYSAWFSDPAIDKYIGPAWTDQELTEIFSDNPGSVLSASISNDLVGVVTLQFPLNEPNPYAITAIAVNPKMQRTGIAEQIIYSIQKYFDANPSQEWVAYVSPSNVAAESLLVKLGWQKGELENKLYRYSFKQSGA